MSYMRRWHSVSLFLYLVPVDIFEERVLFDFLGAARSRAKPLVGVSDQQGAQEGLGRV